MRLLIDPQSLEKIMDNDNSFADLLLNRRFVTIYGIAGLGVMAVLLVLLWMKLIPTEYYVPIFVVAFIIWSTRLVLRVMLARKERRESEGDPGNVNPKPEVRNP